MLEKARHLKTEVQILHKEEKKFITIKICHYQEQSFGENIRLTVYDNILYNWIFFINLSM